MKLVSQFKPKDDARRQRATVADSTTDLSTRLAPSPAARNLAMAHLVERLIERGVIADYTHAARILGVSQPRMTHLMGLVLLAPAVQDAILLGSVALKDKELRELARVAEWRAQEAAVRGGAGVGEPWPRSRGTGIMGGGVALGVLHGPVE